ncbi:unnamed protein product [Aphanomyces euteiches]
MATPQSPYASLPIDAEEKRQVVARLATEVRNKYCIPEQGEWIAHAVEIASFDDAATLGEFAQKLTSVMFSVNQDGHLNVAVTQEKQDEPPATETPSREDMKITLEDVSDSMLQRFYNRNFGVPKVEVLAGRVGYINWTSIVFDIIARDYVISALNLVSATEALIVDLRECGGGDPDTADILYATLFDPETHVNDFYWRPIDTTKARIVGQKDKFPELKRTYFGKPVYILTSHDTFSCGEEIAYTLQAFGKAKVVGTRTGGGGHPGMSLYLHPYLTVFLPTGRNINTKTLTDWEGVGVVPDVQVASADDALDVAHGLALKHVLAAREAEWSKKPYMQTYLETLRCTMDSLNLIAEKSVASMP